MPPTPGHASRRRVPQQARSRRKVAAILYAARRVLETDGADRFNTNRIAEEAGVGIASLYEYFPNKESVADQLIEQIAERESSAILKRFDEFSGKPLHEMIHAAVQVTFRLYRRNHVLYRALWSIGSTKRGVVGYRPGEVQILEAIRDLLQPYHDRLSVRDLDLASLTSFHLVESLAFQMVAHGFERWSEKRYVDEITTAVMRYLGLQNAA